MLNVENMNTTFKTGQKLLITGKALGDTGFSINIGHCENNIALHFNPRFSDQGDSQTIVCNSKKEGSWQSEERQRSFLFHPHQDFEVTINFSDQQFDIKLPNDNMYFPNRFGDVKFKHIHFQGAVRIHSISIT